MNKKSVLKLSIAIPMLLAIAVLIVIQTETGGYLYRGAVGHTKILLARQPIDKLLNDENLEKHTADKLRLVLAVRDFARTQLVMPEVRGYTSVAQIAGTYPGWNVYAAPALSTEPIRWCFPLVGCVVYRGYFSKQAAEEFAAKITQQQGLDTYVAPFIGYSSLGYFADPLLSSQLQLDAPQLAALVIHELAHQKLYLPGNAKINEAFARLVEREGVIRWLEYKGEWQTIATRRAAWRAIDEQASLVITTRDALQKIYESDMQREEKLAHKQRLLLALHRQLCATPCANMAHTDFTNARLIPYTTYNEELTAMYQLYNQAGGDFATFYQLVATHYAHSDSGSGN